MNMASMDKHLSDLGFKVTRNYKQIAGKSTYEFIIEFDGFGLTRYFSYPTDNTPDERDLIQKDFLENLVKEFVQLFISRYNRIPELTECYFRKPIGYATDPEMILKYPNVFAFGGRNCGKTAYMNQVLNRRYGDPFHIKNVIFNNPATIVFWNDGTKTVVKCQDGDVFDPEKGLALAISKKALGNKGNYCNELKKWLPKEEKKSDVAELEFTLECDGAEILKSIAKNGVSKTKSITFEIKDVSLED